MSDLKLSEKEIREARGKLERCGAAMDDGGSCDLWRDHAGEHVRMLPAGRTGSSEPAWPAADAPSGTTTEDGAVK